MAHGPAMGLGPHRGPRGPTIGTRLQAPAVSPSVRASHRRAPRLSRTAPLSHLPPAPQLRLQLSTLSLSLLGISAPLSRPGLRAGATRSLKLQLMVSGASPLPAAENV